MSKPMKFNIPKKGLSTGKPNVPAAPKGPAAGISMPHVSVSAPMKDIPEKKRKIKFLDSEWMIFAESVDNEEEMLYASHYCAGTPEFQKEYERANGRPKLPFFNKAVNVEKSDKCKDCGAEVPKQYLMAIKLNNLKYE